MIVAVITTFASEPEEQFPPKDITVMRKRGRVPRIQT